MHHSAYVHTVSIVARKGHQIFLNWSSRRWKLSQALRDVNAINHWAISPASAFPVFTEKTSCLTLVSINVGCIISIFMLNHSLIPQMSPTCSTYIIFYAPWLFGFLSVSFSDSYSPKMIGCGGWGGLYDFWWFCFERCWPHNMGLNWFLLFPWNNSRRLLSILFWTLDSCLKPSGPKLF